MVGEKTKKAGASRARENLRLLATLRRAELLRLMSRTFGFRDLESTETWRLFGFLIGNAIAIFPPGKFTVPGRKLPGKWPAATLEIALGRRDDGLIPYLKEIERTCGAKRRGEIEDAIISGLKRAIGWTVKRRRLITADRAAALLNVHQIERERSNIRTIGAVDQTKNARLAKTKDTKRQRDRDRAAAKRRAAGAIPRDQYESQSATAQAREIGVSRRTLYRLRKNSNAKDDTGPSPHS